jgi:hypothetical protein
MEASPAWEIVDLGANSWEVVVGEGQNVRELPRPAAEDVDAEGPGSDPPAGWRTHTDERLAVIERRLGDLDQTEDRIGHLERAQAEVERSLDERDAALREEIEEIYRHAQRRLADTDGKPGWIQRRHERRLARLERDRKIRRAERRLEERAQASLARVDREGLAVEQRLRATRVEAQHELDTLSALLDTIDAAEARFRSASERAVAARCRALGHERPIDL